MSETRDLGVPLVVLLAGLGVAAWGLATGAAWPAILAAVVGLVGGAGCLRLTLAKTTGRSVFLAIGCLFLIAAAAPPFDDRRLDLVSFGLGGLALAFRTRTLPDRARIALLVAAAVFTALAAAAVVSGRASLRGAAGLALAGAFACAVNVVSSRPRAPAPPPVGPLVAVFGGSFDPFHAGHRAICESVLRAVDRLLVVVAARPPHKVGEREPTPFHHRVAMSRLGVEGLPRTEVLEIEGRRDGPSYTVDTLEALRRLYPPGTRFRLVLGADSLQDFPLWHDWEGILDRADLFVAVRPGHDLDPPPEFEGRNAPITRLEMHPVEASSTEIRRRVTAGDEVGGMLTPAVAAYVADHALYQEVPASDVAGASSSSDPGAQDAGDTSRSAPSDEA
ncbi:MAG TPA: nicotinate (nicotinamide) nucleotide adenylyltransferase [Planctomycetota bacterium]|nr:nicotinate (nicotinamide) nucleotide adenylyltransferase [Planctomycetota bacterium]